MGDGARRESEGGGAEGGGAEGGGAEGGVKGGAVGGGKKIAAVSGNVAINV